MHQVKNLCMYYGQIQWGQDAFWKDQSKSEDHSYIMHAMLPNDTSQYLGASSAAHATDIK